MWKQRDPCPLKRVMHSLLNLGACMFTASLNRIMNRSGLDCVHACRDLSRPLFPFVRGEVMPATFSLPHLLVFSILLCLVSSSSSLPPLLPSSHLSLHVQSSHLSLGLPVSSCPALVTLPLSSVIGHRPSFLRVQPTVICS